MSLLEFEHVRKRAGSGAQERVVLDDVSFALEKGQLAVVWGSRRSGRSTLLRLAAGIEAPDGGVVRFQGRTLDGRDRHCREGLCFARESFLASEGQTVLDHLVIAQMSHGVRASQAREVAFDVLGRTDARHCAGLRPADLEAAELARVVIARALTRSPRVLVVDEPTLGVGIRERDSLLALLQSLVAGGVTVLASTSDAAGLSGVDHVLSLHEGRLQWDVVAQRDSVVPIRRSQP